MTVAPLRIAVIGCGDIAPIHFDAIRANPDAELVAVCDIDTDLAARTAAQFGCAAHTDLAVMLATARPDVLHICTPHYLHAPMAVAALAADVHVLLEKPLATTVSDGEAVARAARSSRASIAVCFQNRYNNTAETLRKLLDGAELGRVLGGKAAVTWFRDESYYRRRPWRGTWAEGGGGVLINQAIHTLDLLQWYLGDVEEVRGHADRLSLPDPVQVEDTAVIQLRHTGEARSIFYASNGYVDNAPVTLELVAEGGSVRLDTDLTVNYADGTTDMTVETQLATGEKAYWGASHGLLIDDFYRHVRKGRPFWIDATEALKTVRIITSVYAQSVGLR